MRIFLEDRKFYVKNEDGFIYVVKSYEANINSLYFYLELVAGIDYTNPDTSDTQGYVKADNFINDIQNDIIVQYYMSESLIESLCANGYEIIEEIDQRLQTIIDSMISME